MAALPVLGCSSGEECDTCDDDTDCEEGLVCRNFLEGDEVVEKRCASGVGATSCRR
jgi:hypothetical protein